MRTPIGYGRAMTDPSTVGPEHDDDLDSLIVRELTEAWDALESDSDETNATRTAEALADRAGVPVEEIEQRLRELERAAVVRESAAAPGRWLINKQGNAQTDPA
jgi:hypothetical protein